MEKISAIVITKNEEKNIEQCLGSINWADEIIVVDSESEDKTIKLAKKFTDKLFIKKWEGYVPQKRYALSFASCEWVLHIDADERISPELKEEIIKKEPDSLDGFIIRRKNYFFDKEITTCGWNKDYQLRLFRKSKTTLNEKLVHEGFVVEGKTGKLENVIIHNTFSSLHNYLKKVNEYTSLRAEEVYKSKSKVTALTILTHTVSAFFRYFISLKGFKDGMHGLIISFVNSVSTMLTYVKIWEKQRR
ncbi:MAG: glycosyltransferase family 2 protein [Ignavibacteria bacterium]|nr:glycosyltransferase family 2 protein [Ignavibacteria bacterium]